MLPVRLALEALATAGQDGVVVLVLVVLVLVPCTPKIDITGKEPHGT